MAVHASMSVLGQLGLLVRFRNCVLFTNVGGFVSICCACSIENVGLTKAAGCLETFYSVGADLT